MNKFAERLKDLRVEKNLSQRQLAKELGISQAAIARWESGSQIPNIVYGSHIAQYFSVSLDYLAGIED